MPVSKKIKEVNVAPDHLNYYDSINKDIIGGTEEADSDEEEDIPKPKGKRRDDNEDKEQPFMLFDFRRGINGWPENIELVDPKRFEVLLEKANEAAEEAIRMKKNDEENENKKDSAVSFSGSTTAWSWESAGDKENVDEIKSGPHPDAVFETLKDGSTALIMKPGYRLKLNLNDLLQGGDATKQDRIIKETKRKKRMAKYASNTTGGGTSMMYDDVWNMTGPSLAGGSKWFKEYVNEYTISMDIKLIDEPPRDGIALFQTALIHSRENKKTGKTTLSRSDGECFINQQGGVGMFGTYGDITKAKLDIGLWKRVVVSVKCVDDKNAKGEMKTWVNTEAGAVLKEDSIVANERFALDPSGLFIFSSGQGNMVPGNVAIRTIRVAKGFCDDKMVRENRARDKVLSMFNEERMKEAEEQRKGLSLAPLFAKPRPLWIAPAFIAALGDAFIEKSVLEASSCLAWSYAVLSFVIQRMIKMPMFTRAGNGLDHAARVSLSDSAHIIHQSAAVFKLMQRMLKTPTSSQLLSFLRKLKNYIASVKVGESLLLPAFVENEELLLLLERSDERNFRVVVIQTNPHTGLRHHAVAATVHTPNISYRTCMVLDNIPKKNIADDVFWMALYRMCINVNRGDMDRFYDILIPFLTGKPLEESLCDAERSALNNLSDVKEDSDVGHGVASDAATTVGGWRLPQKSSTAYVRCVFEAIHYLLHRRGVSEFQSNYIQLCICTEMVYMMENDLHHVPPDDNGVRVCELAVRELSHMCVKLVDEGKASTSISVGSGSKGLVRDGSASMSSSHNLQQQGFEECKGNLVVDTGESKVEGEALEADAAVSCQFDESPLLEEVHTLVESINVTLKLYQNDEIIAPPALDLHGSDESNVMQFQDILAWEMCDAEPDPGQAVTLRKYLPVDLLQIPKKATTRASAVRAIRLCDRLVTLTENQCHCIKNDKFIIAAVIEHVFTQVLPLPKPRGVTLQEKDLHTSERCNRRLDKKRASDRHAVTGKTKKLDKIIKRSNQAGAGAGTGDNLTSQMDDAIDKENDNDDSKSMGTSDSDDEVKCIGEEVTPDYSVGKLVEASMLEEYCLWDEPITYELQVELLITLQRIAEHFASAAMSIQQSRPFDSVCITVSGCIAAIADAIMRKVATDEPSEMCTHLSGRTATGRQLGHPGFGIGIGNFATQSETIEFHNAELCIARTAVLDYFLSPAQRRLEKIFRWEESFLLVPGKGLIKYMRNVARDIGLAIAKPHLMLCDGCPITSDLMKNYPELHCYRDIIFWWKFFLNTDRKAFKNYVNPLEPRELPALSRMDSQLKFDWDDNHGCFNVTSFDGNTKLFCRPDPKQVDPITGKVLPLEYLPTHRFPSTATPSFYVPAPAINSEDDVVYRPNLPNFEDKYGQVLSQRDAELLISYLTVPYMRIPLLLSFFATEDRIHKLQSKELRLILDSVLFEPGKYLSVAMSGVSPVMVPSPQTELLATPYGLLLNELCQSPTVIINSVLSLLRSALACDTGSIVDEDAKEFNTSTLIIMYITRFGARIDNYLSFIIDIHDEVHDCLDGPYRDCVVNTETIQLLKTGRQELRNLLDGSFSPLFEDYLLKLDQEISKNPTNEKLLDRNSRMACDLHSHKLLLYRNYHVKEMSQQVAQTLIGGFVYLTTRHTWNKSTAEGSRLQMPETELYELLQVQRRRLLTWLGNSCSQGLLDEIMQTALQLSSSFTGSFRTSALVLNNQNRWSRIQGTRSIGRWAVGSTRTTMQSKSLANMPIELQRGVSYWKPVSEVPDTGMLGVEIDVQIGQMTLRSKHLSALIPEIANHPDVARIFGDATIQASLVELAEHRHRYRLVGLSHELEYWPSAHKSCPPLADQWERDYDPANLFDSEHWIATLFEPVRKSFFDGPQPPPMQFMMTEKATPEDAEVAVMLGLHQSLGGPWKLVYLFRRIRCVHVYECVSQGREFWFTLHLTTDHRYCLRDLQPSFADRQTQYPSWWIRGAGNPYPMGVHGYLINDIDGISAAPSASVLIIRDTEHHLNLSGGKEVLVPSRLLYGIVPDALLDAYTFWQDESRIPMGPVDYYRMAWGEGMVPAAGIDIEATNVSVGILWRMTASIWCLLKF